MNNTIIKTHFSFDNKLVSYLNSSILNFFKEVNIICECNKIDNFQEWFTESTYLSIFTNAQIRNNLNSNFSSLQEFSVKKFESSSNGRCDALFTLDDSLFLVETKLQKYQRRIDESHWDMKGWEKYDNHIFEQLKWYFEAEKYFYERPNIYKSIYFQTMVFKIIEIDSELHFINVDANLNSQEEKLNGRGWYYGCYFPEFLTNKNLGLEIYGTITNDLK